MKKIILILLVLQLPVFAYDNYVNGYYRQNGTYVQPHYQTQPNNNVYDNYSTRGNQNPYTGQRGYVNPDTQPTYYQPSIPRTPHYKSNLL